MTVHEHILQGVSARMDHELDADEAFLISCHLAECGDCLAVAEAYARVDALARAVLLPAGPAPFEATVAARLAAEPASVAPAAGPGAGVEVAPVPPAGRRAPAPGRPPAGRSRPRQTRPQRSRPRRTWLGRRILLTAGAALLALVAVVGVAVVVPSTGPGHLPQQVALADVLARAESAAAQVQALRGSYTRTGRDLDAEVTGTFRFTYAQPDRLRVDGGAGSLFRLLIHDGVAARRVWLLRGERRATVWDGTPLVRPQDTDALAPLAEGFGWYGAQLTDPRQPAMVQTREGRRVYVLILKREKTYEEVTGPVSFTHYEVWVDAERYLPVRIQHQDRSGSRTRVVEDTRFTYKQVNGPVTDDAFAIPEGARRLDGGAFQPMGLGRARSLARYRTAEVGKLPGPDWKLLRAGYGRVGAPTGSEAGNPTGRDLVVAVYGLGLHRLTVTSLLVSEADLAGGADGPFTYDDPFGAEGAMRATRDHRLRGGAYKGTEAHLGLPPDRPAYLWFRARDGVVVTISGTVTADQLIAAAESLRR